MFLWSYMYGLYLGLYHENYQWNGRYLWLVFSYMYLKTYECKHSGCICVWTLEKLNFVCFDAHTLHAQKCSNKSGWPKNYATLFFRWNKHFHRIFHRITTDSEVKTTCYVHTVCISITLRTCYIWAHDFWG